MCHARGTPLPSSAATGGRPTYPASVPGAGELCALAYAVRAREMGEGQVATRLQVVEIGCCASSDRPLGLGLPEELAWFDVDLPAEAAAKAQRVLDSGADIADYRRAPALSGARPGRSNTCAPQCCRTVSSHYKKADFVETLRDHGWSPGVPTIWTVGWLPRWDRRTGDVVLKCITAGARQTPCSALALMVHGPRPRVVDFLGAIGWHRVEVLTPPGGGPVRAVTAWMGRCVDQSG
eukprot:scaffold21.g2190.t1